MNTSRPLRIAFAACAAVALAVAAGPAFAHAKLLSESPPAEDAPGAVAGSTPVTEFRLTFSEGLNAAFSKAIVTDAAGNPVATQSIALDPSDDKVLVVTFAAPLTKGEYSVDWTAVAGDGHKTTGTYKVNVAQ